MNLEEIKKKCLVLDIETSSQWPDGKIIDIRTHFEDYVKFAKCKWFGAYSYLHDEYIKIEVWDREELIKEYIEQHDTLVSFNGEEFDVPILYNNNLMPENKRFLQVDCLVILGANTFFRHDGLAFKNRGALMGYKFKKNSLKAMAETMQLETQKGDIDYKIFLKTTWTAEEKEEIKKYLESDVKVTKQMFDLLWDYWMPFTEFLDEKNVRNLTWIRSSVASLTYQCACNTMGVEPTYGEHKDKVKQEMGGRVIEPKYQEATGVWYVDFASLYPHIYTMFNLFSEICSATITTPGEAEEKLSEAWHGNDLFKVEGYYDISKQHILGEDVARKLKIRATLKKEDPSNPLIYAFKIFLNSLYGAQRSPIFEQIHTPNGGWDCCWLGQQIQEYTEKRMADFGFETIAGDTDSIFVKLKEDAKIFGIDRNPYTYNKKNYVKDCLNNIVEEIKANVPFPAETFKIDIENYLEYVMWPFSMQPVVGDDGKNLKNEKGRLVKELKGKKKNYLYLYNKDGDLKLKIMGMPIIKDNATLLGKKILEETIKPNILERKSAKFTKQEMNLIIDEAIKKPESIKLLAREFKVKPASSYKLESQIQAQISLGYFGGQDGVINLIKNKTVGKAGKGCKYCTYEEAMEAGLTVKDLDLTKLKNELEPFMEVL